MSASTSHKRKEESTEDEHVAKREKLNDGTAVTTASNVTTADTMVAPEEAKHTAIKFLKQATIADVIKGTTGERARVVTLTHNMKLIDAMHELARNKILSAPVLMDTSIDDLEDSGSYMGILDVSQILKHIITELESQESEQAEEEKQGLGHLADRAAKILQARVITVMGHDVDFVMNMNTALPLLDAITAGFLQKRVPSPDGSLKDMPHVHRLALFDAHGRITHIISMSDIIRYLQKNLDRLGNIKEFTVEQLGLIRYDVVTVETHTKTIDAFKHMYDCGVSSCAIVKDDQIVGSVSASDLRGIQLEDLAHLQQPIYDYLLGRLAGPHPSGTAGEGYEDHQHDVSQHTHHHHHRHEHKEEKETPKETGKEESAKEGTKTPSEQETALVAKKEPEPHLPVYAVTATDTLETVLGLFVRQRLHRVYIVDNERKPIGIVTHADVLAHVAYPPLEVQARPTGVDIETMKAHKPHRHHHGKHHTGEHHKAAKAAREALKTKKQA